MSDYKYDALVRDVKEHVEPSKYRDVLYGGCISGTVGGLCYYVDTVAFHDKHEDAIWDMLYQEAKDADHEGDIMSFIQTFQGAKDIGSMEQLKNLLCWYSVETIVRRLADELENDGVDLQDEEAMEKLDEAQAAELAQGE